MIPAHVQALLEPAMYAHPTPRLALLQTHASFVVLTGPFAYKLKKPVNFGFLDYSTLDKRKHFIQEELRLNRRFAPEIYLEALCIKPMDGGFALAPIADDAGAVDYCVRMVEFPQEQLMSRLAEQGSLPPAPMEALMRAVAAAHAAAPAHTELPFLPRVMKVVNGNYDVGERFAGALFDAARLAQIRAFTDGLFAAHADFFVARGQGGRIRECHGDLHSKNLVLLGERFVAFDCIEFADDYRIIDVMAELAFFVMDLEELGFGPDANRCLNEYLERSGDWAGVRVLPLYLCYRAFVRAKINALTSADANVASDERARSAAAARKYFDLAWRYADRFGSRREASLTLMYGHSGAGKSTVAKALAAKTGAVHIRSDAVRKHLAGVSLDAAPGGAVPGLYAPDLTERTYARLAELALVALEAGFPVILDARYPTWALRAAALAVARAAGVPARIVVCEAPREELAARLEGRTGDVSDATTALLERQAGEAERPGGDEAPVVTAARALGDVGRR
jgi:aminoglycoside phosphotransferase family enzyme/predicted kinase